MGWTEQPPRALCPTPHGDAEVVSLCRVQGAMSWLGNMCPRLTWSDPCLAFLEACQGVSRVYRAGVSCRNRSL